MNHAEFDLVRGWNAAARGQDPDQYETEAYYEGYALWTEATAGQPKSLTPGSESTSDRQSAQRRPMFTIFSGGKA